MPGEPKDSLKGRNVPGEWLKISREDEFRNGKKRELFRRKPFKKPKLPNPRKPWNRRSLKRRRKKSRSLTLPDKTLKYPHYPLYIVWVMKMDVVGFIKEDIVICDITSEALLGEEWARAEIVTKQDCVIGGLSQAVEIFRYFGLDVKNEAVDGESVSKGKVVLTIEGRAKDILAGERLSLNFLARMSGIATETRMLVDKCQKINSNVEIAATRKTTPGFRVFEKRAVELGGGYPHRYHLDDAFLIKDNHLALVPSIKEAVGRAKSSKFAKQGKKVEIEVENLKDALAAVEEGADIVMLDNMSPEEAKWAYLAIKEKNKDVIVEISGGITPDNIEKYAAHADMISLGYLTHSISAVDFSLDLVKINSGD